MYAAQRGGVSESARAGRVARTGEGSVDFAILGSIEATADGRPLDLGPPKERAVLAALLLHPNEIVATDRLVGYVWGDAPPRTAAHSIQIYVSDLRKRFGQAGAPAVITTRAPGYVLHAEPDTVDAARFEALVTRGTRELRAGDVRGGAETLRAALGLWRGPPLVEVADADFCRPHIHRLEELRAQAVEGLADAELRLGEPQRALTELAALVDQHPFRERTRELQLLALYRSGRQVDALRTYETFRHRLRDELGLDPSPILQQLQGRILVQDPTLVPTPIASPHGTGARNPFKGLRSFTEDDQDDFFGRRRLVEQLCAALASDARLVALVGPSGCGKSSAVAAGLLPALRADAIAGASAWRIVGMVPGSDPQAELAAALAGPTTDTLLWIDQFEELFALTDEDATADVLEQLVAMLGDEDRRLRVLVTMRADFYDQPLRHPGFAELFAAAVVTVLPLTAAELETAITEPARRVGVEVEPALVTQLVTDAVDRPGALPHFQFVLTELFEHRRDQAITVDAYHELGGLHGALSRRAEDVYGRLTASEQHVAKQVLLRLVTPGVGTRDVRRRARATELSGLGLDPVEIARVLDRFGCHRLLTFDRDVLNGEATVEVAHEALLDAWDRLRDGIDRHRADLRQLEHLTAAVDEWATSGHEPGYLLSGTRLDQYLAWSQRTELVLSADAHAFLTASEVRRREEHDQDAARRAEEAQLRTRARRRLWALFASVTLLAAAVTALALATQGDRPPAAAVVGETPEHGGPIAQLIAAGATRAGATLGVEVEQASPVTDTTIEHVIAQGAPLVITSAGVFGDHPAAHPDTHFALLDYYADELRQNVTFVTFATHEGSYLVGAAAALTSETGRIGFIGGVDLELIHSFEAGYVAGARQVAPDIEVQRLYLTQHPDFSGFGSPTLAARAAADLYRDGVDVIYHAAGQSGVGLFETAVAESRRQGRHLWAIGVDGDEYLDDTVRGDPRLWRFGPEDWRPHLLTSMVKRYDRVVHDLIVDFHTGRLEPGVSTFDLANGGIDYATSGGFVDHLVPRLEGLKADIIAGRIEVPTVPDEPPRLAR
jgi:basic membrane lipoprotein Med (substrate-binding protein (PBP1-ABC) superfamily)/DNA-binding SARP family transcriptional activator